MIVPQVTPLPPISNDRIAGHVALFLSDYAPKGSFCHGDKYGRKTSRLKDGVRRMGILYTDPALKPKKYFFGLITIKPRPTLLGMLHFPNSPRNPDNEEWLFEMCSGHSYTSQAMKLIADLRSEYGVRIFVASEKPKVRRKRLCNQTYN